MPRVSLFQPSAKYEIFAGRLYVRDRRQTLTVKPWGRGMGAWRLEGLTSWGEAALSLDVRELASRGAFWAEFLLNQWPAEAVRAVAQVEDWQWTLLRLANEAGQAFLEILETNLALGAAMAWSVERGAALSTAAGLCGRKRRQILAELGMEPSDRAVRILARVPASELESGLFEQFEAQQDGWSEMCYWPCVTARSAALLTNRELRTLTTRRFRREFAGAGKRAQIEALRTLQQAAAHMEQFRVELEPARHFRALDRHARERWRLEQRVEEARRAARRFSPPPRPPGPGMEALLDADALLEEGESMHHCCASYLNDVRAGRMYFYRMLEPERLTVCLEKRGTGWELGQARGVANRLPGRAGTEALGRWLGASTECDNE